MENKEPLGDAEQKEDTEVPEPQLTLTANPADEMPISRSLESLQVYVKCKIGDCS